MSVLPGTSMVGIRLGVGVEGNMQSVYAKFVERFFL